jgi:hypothetical protein
VSEQQFEDKRTDIIDAFLRLHKVLKTLDQDPVISITLSNKTYNSIEHIFAPVTSFHIQRSLTDKSELRFCGVLLERSFK